MAQLDEIVNPDDIKNIKELTASFNALNKELEDLKNENKKVGQSHEEYSKMVNRAADVNNKLTMTAKELENQNKQLQTTNIKLSQVESSRNKELQKQKIALADANKEIRDQIKLEQAASGSLNGAKLAWAAFGKSVMAGTGIVKSFNLAVKATGAAIASIPIVGWIAMAVTGLGLMASKLVKNAQEFGKASASLSAITGATGKDLDFMKQKAKEYARESTLSATEVLTAFEKIGSAAPQLLKNKEALVEVTKAAITLSESTGGKLLLEDAAKATTAAMNQFNIPASEAGRIINVLAAGSQAGSAEVQDLTASFKNVGAVASSAGMSLEETVAALETLGEKGLYAEEAGTKLRGSIMRLQKAGMGYASGSFDLRDALTEVNGKMEQQVTQAEKDKLAIKLFGAENITAGRILLENVDKFDSLTAAVTGTNTAYEMAEIQTNNLTASKEKFGNAWRSLMLSIEDGGGILSKIWKGFLDGMTAAFNGISKFIDKFKSKEALERKAAKIAEKEREEEAKATEELEKEKAKVEEESNKKKAASAKKAAEERKKIEEAKADAVVKAAEREYEMQLLLIKASGLSKEEQEAKTFELKKQYLQKSLDLLEKELNAVKGNELEKLKIQEKINGERAKLDSVIIDERIAENEKAGGKIIKSDEVLKNRAAKQQAKYDDDLVKTTEQTAAKKQAIAETEVDKVKMSEDEKAAIIQASTEAIIQIQGAVFDFINNGYNNELTLLEQKNQQGLLSDKEYAKQKAEIEIKQAKLAKLQGIFDATINTAKAITSALTVAPPAGTILAVAAGIAGGLQVASILSQPLPTIPAFAEGTKNAPSFGLAGEAGTELGITKTGESILFDKPTIFKGEKFKGMHIYSNPELEAMKATNQFNYVSDNTALRDEIKLLRQDIQNKPVFIFDKEHNIVGKKIGNYTEKYVNRLKFGD